MFVPAGVLYGEGTPDENNPLAITSLAPPSASEYFTDSSLVDFSFLLDRPAGKHGFLATRDNGHFYFEDGNQARFWGVVITQQHVNMFKLDKVQAHARIDQAVRALARAGVNLVRFHSLDNDGDRKLGIVRPCVIKSDDEHGLALDPDYLDRLDYWICRLKEHGIYTMIALRAFRHFYSLPDCDALGRGARPYACFDPRLIELQQQFAEALLAGHVNYYTGLPYVQDPSVALVEIYNEDSILYRPHLWHEMAEPYRKHFVSLWNSWLKERYSTTVSLRLAWTNQAGVSALASGESLETGNIALPSMKRDGISLERSFSFANSDPQYSPARRHDALLFARHLMEKYHHAMKSALRRMGVRVPLTGVGDGRALPDSEAAASSLDFTAENWYWDHPSFARANWKPPVYHHNLPHGDNWGFDTLANHVAAYRWRRTPLMVREWANSWPNPSRGGSILEMAAYACLQDWDALTFFDYLTADKLDTLSTFGLNTDPVRWGLFGLAAKLFLNHEVAAARHTITLAYSEEDLAAYASYETLLNSLAWLSRLEHRRFSSGDTADSSLTILSGRSHSTAIKGDRLMICGQAPWNNALEQRPITPRNYLSTLFGYDAALLRPGPGKNPRLLFSAEPIQRAGYEPIPTSPAQPGVALGFWDDQARNLVLASCDDFKRTRFAVEFLNRYFDTPTTKEMWAARQQVSDTGELRRDTSRGLFHVDTPSFQAITGSVNPGARYQTSQVSLVSSSPTAALAVTSLDGLPLAISRRFVLKMVTEARNTDQGRIPDAPPLPGRFALREGRAPILCGGEPGGDRATTISFRGQPLVAVYLIRGYWELVLDLDKNEAWIFCDTAGAKIALHWPETQGVQRDSGPGPAAGREENSYSLTAYRHHDQPPLTLTAGNSFTYPSGARYLRLARK